MDYLTAGLIIAAAIAAVYLGARMDQKVTRELSEEERREEWQRNQW